MGTFRGFFYLDGGLVGGNGLDHFSTSNHWVKGIVGLGNLRFKEITGRAR